MLNKIIRYFLENRVITILILVLVVIWGLSTSPFNWHGGIIPRNPIPVDAIPDIGDNQQIVATEWMGRSPKDIQDQITYPLTASLLGIPGVKSIRSSSMFGMSFIYIIFDDNIEFYWSRSRILEKLNSLPPGTLPEGVQPALGPDATALGQIYWYTLEGRDPATRKPTGGWNAEELRTLQDYYVKYSLSAAEGVSEVASAGGFVKEYQVELNPEAMRAFNVSVMDIMSAIKKSNLDIGAETMEINKVEYLIRGLGYIKNVSDLEKAVVTVRDGVPVRISDIAFVNIGPGTRRGGLDKEGVEAVGGVVIARYGSNPLEVINNVKDKIKEMAPGLPQNVAGRDRLQSDRSAVLRPDRIDKRDDRHTRNIVVTRNPDLYHRHHCPGSQSPGFRRDSQHATYSRIVYFHHYALHGNSCQYRGTFGYRHRYRCDGGCRSGICRKHHPVYGDAGKQRYSQRKSDGEPYL